MTGVVPALPAGRMQYRALEVQKPQTPQAAPDSHYRLFSLRSRTCVRLMPDQQHSLHPLCGAEKGWRSPTSYVAAMKKVG